jgi:alcohol dehydrogenase
VCGADIGLVAARSSAYGFPVTPGHEIAGIIAELGDGVEGHAVGDRVAVGWFGGSCGHCTACRTGDPVHCPERRTPGVSYPGGWAGSITVPASALAAIPDGLTMAEAAPFGCAGVTAFNAVRTGHPQPGDLVAVLGIGGVGHMALQFAARMGYETVAIARGDDKEADARALGAHHYIDSAREQPGQALRALGGAALAISTAASTGPIPELVDGLATRGHLTVVGLGGDMSVALRVDRLVMGARTVGGQLTGSTADTEQAMKFAVDTGIRPRIETVPLTSALEALRALGEGRPRYRTVLTPDSH